METVIETRASVFEDAVKLSSASTRLGFQQAEIAWRLSMVSREDCLPSLSQDYDELHDELGFPARSLMYRYARVFPMVQWFRANREKDWPKDRVMRITHFLAMEKAPQDCWHEVLDIALDLSSEKEKSGATAPLQIWNAKIVRQAMEDLNAEMEVPFLGSRLKRETQGEESAPVTKGRSVTASDRGESSATITKELQGVVEESRQAIEELKGDIDEKRQVVQSLEEQLKSLEAENLVLHQRLQSMERQARRIKQLEEENRQLRAELEERVAIAA